MIQDLTKYVGFLVKYKITPQQFLLPYCLFLDRLEKEENGRWYRQKSGGSSKPIANLYKYSTFRTWTNEEIEDLIEKGLIAGEKTLDKSSGEKVYFPDMLRVTPRFISEMFVTEDGFEEFWNLYPGFADNFNDPLHGPKVRLKAVSYEALEAEYKKIVQTEVMHSRVMRALRYEVEKGMVNMGIQKWLESRQWLETEKLMEEGYGSETHRGRVL